MSRSISTMFFFNQFISPNEYFNQSLFGIGLLPFRNHIVSFKLQSVNLTETIFVSRTNKFSLLVYINNMMHSLKYLTIDNLTPLLYEAV